MSADEAERLKTVMMEALRPYVFRLGRWLATGAFVLGGWLTHLTLELNAARADRLEWKAWREAAAKSDSVRDERISRLEGERLLGRPSAF